MHEIREDVRRVPYETLIFSGETRHAGRGALPCTSGISAHCVEHLAERCAAARGDTGNEGAA